MSAPADGSALLLIDFQRDFCEASGRLPVAMDQVEPALAAARRAMAAFREAGRPIVAIGNEFRRNDRLMNLLRRHAAIAGSRGAEWDPRLPRDDLPYFAKWATSAFVNPEIDAWLRARSIDELVLCGLKAGACVTATARDALLRGYRVHLVREAILCNSDRSRTRALARLERQIAVSRAKSVATA